MGSEMCIRDSRSCMLRAKTFVDTKCTLVCNVRTLDVYNIFQPSIVDEFGISQQSISIIVLNIRSYYFFFEINKREFPNHLYSLEARLFVIAGFLAVISSAIDGTNIPIISQRIISPQFTEIGFLS